MPSATRAATGRRMPVTVPDEVHHRVLPGVYPAPAVKIFVIGAGQVGTAVVESLHSEHDVTVVDLDTARLNALSYRYDIATVEANGAADGRSPTRASAAPTS